MNRRIDILIFLSLLIITHSGYTQQSPSAETNVKSYLELSQIQVVPIKDSKNDSHYELYIKLPEGYSEDGDFKYPVLYFTDALWHIEILSSSSEFLIENAILVGISWEKDLKGELATFGEHASRFRDYSIQPSSNPETQAKYQLGQASNHLEFIRNDVIKYIENTYRTDPDIRSYFGYSAGAKFGAYILLTQPSTFKNYILGSPSLSGGRDVPVLSELDANETLNANVFISYGNLEKETSPYTDEVIAMLKNKNDESLLVKHEVIKGTHQTAFPMTAVSSVEWLSKHINNFPILAGPYLGQSKPGSTPEVFAPGIVSTEYRDHSAFFTPDMKEFYFTRRSGSVGFSLITFKYENNQWRGSVVGPRLGRPIIDPDNKTMHLGKYYMERTETGWSEVKSHGPMFDRQDWGIMRLSASAKGTYVFDDAKSNDVIRISELKGGKREEPRLLNKNINTGKWTAHPFIAPDESYLIWDSERDDGYGDSDLYISFRQEDNSWGEAINLGDKINTDAWESNGYVTPDGKYFFFNREVGLDNVDIFWVDAQMIESLRLKK